MGANDLWGGTIFDPRGIIVDLCKTPHNIAAY